jgi:hypothetical protein
VSVLSSPTYTCFVPERLTFVHSAFETSNRSTRLDRPATPLYIPRSINRVSLQQYLRPTPSSDNFASRPSCIASVAMPVSPTRAEKQNDILPSQGQGKTVKYISRCKKYSTPDHRAKESSKPYPLFLANLSSRSGQVQQHQRHLAF